MRHSKVLAPVISHCGTCISQKVKDDSPPCCWCHANSQYKEDPNSGATRNDLIRIRGRIHKK